MHHTKPRQGHDRMSCLVAIPLIFFSCKPVRLVQDFDDTTERRLLQVQDKCSRFFVRMERQAGTVDASVAKYVDFYEDVRTDIDVLLARSRAITGSGTTMEQLDLLRREIDQLEDLHRKGFKSWEEVKPLHDGIEGTLVAMQKYQFTLKNRVK